MGLDLARISEKQFPAAARGGSAGRTAPARPDRPNLRPAMTVVRIVVYAV